MKAELIGYNALSEHFHLYCEQLTGHNPAQIMQTTRRPVSESLYHLGYLQAFHDPESDLSDVASMAGMMHFSMLVAGEEYGMSVVTGWPHGLRCLQSAVIRRGIASVVFAGDGLQWRAALLSVENAPNEVKIWSQVCYRQFDSHNFGSLFSTIGKNSTFLQIGLDNNR